MIFSSCVWSQHCHHFVQLLIGRNKNHAAAGVVQSKRRLLFRQCRVERDGHGSEQQTGHVNRRPLRPVLAKDRDAISATNSPGVQRAGDAGDILPELARADGQPFSDLAIQLHAVEIAFDGCEKDIVQGGNTHRVVRAPAKTPADLIPVKCNGFPSVSAM